MKKLLLAPALALIGMVAALMPAEANFINGRQLQLHCLSKEPIQDAICTVYVIGAVDALTTMDLLSQKAGNTPPRYCIPEGIGPDRLRQVVLAWLDRPETNLEFGATLLVLAAVEDAYGCGS